MMGTMKKFINEVQDKAIQGKSALIQVYKTGFVNLRNTVPALDISVADHKIEIDSGNMELELNLDSNEMEYVPEEDYYKIHDKNHENVCTIELL